MKIDKSVKLNSGYGNTDTNISYEQQKQAKKYDDDLKKITPKQQAEIENQKNKQEQSLKKQMLKEQIAKQNRKQVRDSMFHYKTPEQISYVVSQGRRVSDAEKDFVKQVNPALLQEAERSSKVQDLLLQMQMQSSKLKQIEEEYVAQQKNAKQKSKIEENPA